MDVLIGVLLECPLAQVFAGAVLWLLLPESAVVVAAAAALVRVVVVVMAVVVVVRVGFV